MIKSELVEVQNIAKDTVNRVNKLQVHLDSQLYKNLTALDVDTNDRIFDFSVIEVKESETLYSTVHSK